MRVAFDTENTALLNSSSIDYTQRPYKLKSDFKMHCIVCTDIDTLQVHRFVGEDIKTKFPKFLEGVTQLIGWNNINYDNLVLKLYLGIDYTIGPDTINGRPCQIDDGMILSKTLNPDRPGHSIEWWGEQLGFPKIDWRAEAISLGLIKPNDPPGAEFQTFHPRMVDYCERDTLITAKAYKALMEEWGNWNWQDAYDLEKAVAEIITRQEHRGFHFDIELARSNVEELDRMMEEIRLRVEPMIPPKKPTKKIQGDYTPPKVQFKKDGSPSSNLEKFAAKIGGTIHQDDEGGYFLLWKGRVYNLPLPAESLVTEVPATLADTTHIKEWLVSLGWVPTAFKERDLTVDSRKKKITKEKFKEVVDRYVEQTLESNFCSFRCDHLGVSPENLKQKLLEHDLSKPLKVLTNPSFTVGAEKELCTGLEQIGKKFPHAQDIANWLTYRHRRNSILGGGVDVDDEDDFDKGYLSFVRDDGRIPTPADTCGAATSRFKHRVCANIPRITSLYGENMRAMFGVDSNQCYQLGYDFDSLEAKITGHYIWKYEGGPELAEALIAEKPNDIHCYSEDTEILTSMGWKRFGDLGEEDTVAQWDDGEITFVVPSEIVWQDYEGEMIEIKSSKLNLLVTPNHRMLTMDYHRPAEQFVVEARNLKTKNSNMRIPSAGQIISDGLDVTDDEIRILVAIQADAYLNKDNSGIQFTFVKEEKITRIKQLLSSVGITYTMEGCYRKGREEVKVRIPAGDSAKRLRSFLDEDKSFSYDFLRMNFHQCQVFLDELRYWDGTLKPNGDIVLDTTSEQSIDVVQAIAHMAGRTCQVNKYSKKTTFGTCNLIRAYIGKGKPWHSYHRADIHKVKYRGKIGCVSVPSSFVVVRRGGRVVISGNTLNAKRLGISRNDAKTFFYAALYGAQPNKLAKQLGWPLSKAKKVFNDFWEACKPIQLLRDNLTRYWEKTGQRQFILGLDGRKIPTRSQHALLNSLFQAGGVICAKRAMVIHDRKLKQEGLYIDFFREAW